MTVFGDKLDRIHETVRLASVADAGRLRAALRGGRGRTAIAVGSGGSAVVADYLSRCRSTLGLGRTIVRTPMEFVLDLDDLAGCEVWLVSAGGGNPDISAALRAARTSRAASIKLLTVRPDGAAAIAAASDPRCEVHLSPVADPKDGFIATHSMVAMVTGLLLAGAVAGEVTLDRFRAAVADALLGPARAEAARGPWPVAPHETLLVLEDPQLRAVGTLLETSLWETATCAVQRTDFRNFAHGRHVWPARRGDDTIVLALCTREGRPVWDGVEQHLPTDLRRRTEVFGLGGRFDVALGIVRALALLEGMGGARGVDLGRPGHGAFARDVYEDPELDALARRWGAATRHKLAAVMRTDAAPALAAPSEVGAARLVRLRRTTFHGLALDYDGTIVATEERLEPPGPAVVSRLTGLLDAGIPVAIATGRGGSAGEVLREVLPERVHRSVTMGYYNGAHVRSLADDVDRDPPEQDAEIRSFGDWLHAGDLLAPGGAAKVGRVQVTVDRAALRDPGSFLRDIAGSPQALRGTVRVLASQHSFDVVGARASKARVVRDLATSIGGPDLPILAIGDSGAEGGNDHEMLSGPYGVSVGGVCGDPDGSWSLLGEAAVGPRALLRVLSALVPDGAGRFTLNPALLGAEP